MKRFALFFSLFLLCLVVKANPVTRSQALNEAKSFLETKGIELKSSQVAYRAPRKANAQENESSYYYIFNVGNDQGFVIVSGDDRTEEILGYSDTGSFDEENMPEPLKAWLEGYEREIESIVEADPSETSVSSPRKALEKTKKTIAPLITSMWGSGYPYNSKTPMNSSTGLHSGLGCGTVALSQLMYYYKKQNVSSLMSSINSSIPAGTKLDWDNMLDEYLDLPSKNYSTTQLNAVSNFMYYCALALNINFSNGASSLSKQVPALTKYFGFNPSIAFISREYYSTEEWESIIYNELINDRPVAYYGYYKHSGSTTGHIFIVDGYDISGLFHINWGWKGLNNGFFRLSVLNRYKSGTNTTLTDFRSYAQDQFAMLYANPKSLGDTNTGNCFLGSKITTASSSNATILYVNESGLSGSYLFGIGCMYKDDVILLKQYSDTYSSLANDKIVFKTISLSTSDFAKQGIPFGNDYVLVPMYKLNGDDSWRVCYHNNVAFANYNNSVSLSLNPSTKEIKDSKLYVSGFNIEGNGLINKEQTVLPTIKSGDFGFSGTVYFFASNTTTKGTNKGSLYINLGKNDEITLEFPFTPTAAGNYNIWIATDASGNNVIGQTTLSILNKTQPTLDISKINFGVNKNYAGFINGKRSIWGNTFDVTITGIKNNGQYPIYTTLNIWLREYDSVNSESFNFNRFNSKGDNATWYTQDFYIEAGQTISIPIKFENLHYNSRYDIRVEYNLDATGSNSKLIQLWPMVFLPAVTTWTADGESSSVAPTASVKIGTDVVAVDVTDATVVKIITPSSNPNVLYYMGASQTVPSGLANKNVVKGNVAENITLVDGKDFFVPKRFTAKKINFTTTPTAGVSRGNNNNWRTIALPFEVSSVKNTTDNVDIDWFHSDSDTGKNFWIRKFDRLDTSDNTVIFENTDEMLAYEPYIMNVPDDYWGKKWDLRNKNITFYGENAILHNEATIGNNSSYYNFIGTTVGKTIEDGWFLNDAGDAFKYYNPSIKSPTTKADYTISNTVAPFRAYFVLTKDYFETVGASKTSLRIKFDSDSDSTTDIMAPFNAEEKQVDVYTINGLKVASKKMQNGSIDLSDLPKGIYVINGKKFIQY